MITATNSVLHAYQAVNRPILAMLAGAVVKIISAYFLIGHEGVALLGAPISTFLCNTTVVVCNLFFASRLCDVSGLGAVFWKPTLCASVAVGVSYVSYLLLGTSIAGTRLPTLLALLCAVVLYFALSLIWGVFSEEDIRALPGGERLLPWIQKLRLLPS
jgi:stage V sporulation protein B